MGTAQLLGGVGGALGGNSCSILCRARSLTNSSSSLLISNSPSPSIAAVQLPERSAREEREEGSRELRAPGLVFILEEGETVASLEALKSLTVLCVVGVRSPQTV